MSFLNANTKEILILAQNIISREYKKDNWLSLLDNLTRIFNMDAAFIGLWKDGYIELEYSSILMKKILTENQYCILHKVNIKNRTVFRNKLIKDGYIAIEDYQNYEFALDDWKRLGLQSLLAVTVESKNKIYGSLHIVNISSRVKFDAGHIEAMQIIANTIGSELEKEALMKKVQEEKDINEYYVKLINNMAIENNKPDMLNEWMLSILLKIKALAEAHIISFLFPSEKIFLTLNSSELKTNFDEIKDNPLYDIWENNITDVINYTQYKQDSRLHECSIDMEDVLFIPIVSDNKTISVVCLGFDKTVRLSYTKVELIRNMVKYFSSLIYTHNNISRMSSQISMTEEGLIKAFVSSMEAKDLYTKGHSEHVALYAKKIGEKLGFGLQEQEFLYNAGLLHDIGKIGIPDNILLKPTALTDHEYEIMKLHPSFSYEIVKNIPKFKRLAKCILHHHEKLDGSGYPEGLSGDKIETGARILAIADIFDALTTKRPYRDNVDPDEAINMLEKEPIDQDILNKVKTTLKESYLNELMFQETFVPTKLELARRDLLNRDYATGLYRRKAFIEMVDYCTKESRNFSLFMIDIKNISYINYKYGVDIGDRVILFVAEELRKISKIEALARTASDVFMFVYNGTNPDTFKSIISKELRQGMLDRIKQKGCVINEAEAQKVIGCYITYTLYPDEAKTAEELIYKCISKKKLLANKNEVFFS